MSCNPCLPNPPSPVTCANVGGFLQFSTITALREYTATTVANYQQALIAGYYAPGDGGGGIFYYDDAVETEDNNGTLIVDSDGRRWLRLYSGDINVKWFGAKGDGLADDAVAIDATVQECSNVGGGTVFIPEGTYILGTISEVTGSHNSYIVPQDSVSIIGSGMGATVLKVKSGQNEIFADLNGPNVIATSQATPLTKCRFADFTVNWNGAYNLLTIDMEARQNASIFSLNGGLDTLCERLEILDTPGNNCIALGGDSDVGQKRVTIRNCFFKSNGSGLAGNYNPDHSSIYLNGKENTIEECTFFSSVRVTGACFELHGSDARAVKCKGSNYKLAAYVVANYETTQNVVIDDCHFTEMQFAFSATATSQRIDNVSILNSSFTQSASDSYTLGQAFFDLSMDGPTASGSFKIQNCKFYGSSRANLRLGQWNWIENFSFVDNYASNFADIGLGPRGTPIDGALFMYDCIVDRNEFVDVAQPIYFSVGSYALKNILIGKNTFRKTASTSALAVEIGISAGVGRATDNIVINYTGGTDGVTISPATIYVQNYSEGTWLPVIFGQTIAGTASAYTTQKGQWTKYGNSVRVDIFAQWSGGHTGTGGLSVTLPTGASAPAVSSNNSHAALEVFSESVPLAVDKQLKALLSYGAGVIVLYEIQNAGAASQISLTGLAAGTVIISGTYRCKN